MPSLNTDLAILAEEQRLKALLLEYARIDYPIGVVHIQQTLDRLHDDLRRGGYAVYAIDHHCDEDRPEDYTRIGSVDTVQEFFSEYASSCGDMTYILRDDYGEPLCKVTPMGNIGDRWLAEQSKAGCLKCRGTGKLPSDRYTHERCGCLA